MPCWCGSPGPWWADSMSMPSSTSSFDLYGSSGARIGPSVKSSRSRSAAQASCTVPRPVKKTTKRFGKSAPRSPCRLIASRNGSATASPPAPRRKCASIEASPRRAMPCGAAHGSPPCHDAAAAVAEGVGLGERHEQRLDVVAGARRTPPGAWRMLQRRPRSARRGRSRSGTTASRRTARTSLALREALRELDRAVERPVDVACCRRSRRSRRPGRRRRRRGSGRCRRSARSRSRSGRSAGGSRRSPGPPSAARTARASVASGRPSGGSDVDVGRRRRQRLAEQALAHELAAVDRRGLVRLRVDREQRGVRQEAGALRRIERPPARTPSPVGPPVDAVELGELGVHHRVGRREQRRSRRRLVLEDDVIEERLGLGLEQRQELVACTSG